jgi:D-alanyl-D-alanine carboxypeptidase
VVVLGARSNAGRFWETRHLLNWFSTKAEDLLGGRLEAAAPPPGPGFSAAQ